MLPQWTHAWQESKTDHQGQVVKLVWEEKRKMMSRTCNAKTSLCNKGLSTQSYGISTSHALCELDLKEGWVLKNWCFWIVVLDKTLESRLHCKEIKPVNPKGNESWIFIGKTEAEDETPILCLPHMKSQVTGKDPDAGKDWGQEENGATEDWMVWWHQRLNGHEFEQTPETVRYREAWHAAVHGVTELDIT